MNPSNARILCATLGLVAAMCAPASADPPAAPAEDPRVDTLARLHAAFVTRMFTQNLFARVEGPNADLCRIDLRKPSGETVASRWVRFGARRWEVAYQTACQNCEKSWVHEIAEVSEAGRVLGSTLVTTPAHQPQTRVEDYRHYDWDPGEGLVKVNVAGTRVSYSVDSDNPEIVRVEASNMSGEVQSMRVTRDHIAILYPDSAKARHAFSWRDDGALEMTHDTGQSALHFRYDSRGALERRKEVAARPESAFEPRNVFAHTDGKGRLVTADMVGHGGGLTAHLTYGCAWPKELEEPAPPDEAGAGVTPVTPDAPRGEAARDALARREVRTLVSNMTYGLFQRVEGPYADLCKIESLDRSGKVMATRWVSFDAEHLGFAQEVFDGPRARTFWRVSQVTMSARGRPVRTLHTKHEGDDGAETLAISTYDWSGQDALLTATHADANGGTRRRVYVLDASRPGLMRESIVTESPAETHTQHITLEWSHGRWFYEGGSSAYVRAEDGSEAHTHVDGSTSTFDAHGARTGVTNPDPEGLRAVTRVDDLGRVTGITWTHGEQVTDTRRYTYGCDWPEEFEAPAPPHDAEQTAGH